MPGATRGEGGGHDLRGRRIVVGVSGSIAAYKSVLLVRLLARAGAEVRVLMTPTAATFVAPLTFSTLSKHPVLASVASEEGWNDHVELGLWGDAYVVAPATANTLARLAHGLCDSILAAVYLSARCPVLLAPAMDVDMWHHPATRANVALLRERGAAVVPVGEGELASGLHGAGRLAEPEDIVAAIARALDRRDDAEGAQPLAGAHVLLTSGPTHEPLDPVRFLGNRSSGKTGAAVAAALLARGARVTCVLGPAAVAPAPHARLAVVPVQTARDMHAAALAHWPACGAAVLAAAVADFRPAAPSAEKIKKDPDAPGAGLRLDLVRNPDIAADLAAARRPGQVIVGFALETADALARGRDKLRRKGLDAIVVNAHRPGAEAFGADDNAVAVAWADGRTEEHPRLAKSRVGEIVAEAVVGLLIGDG